MALTITETPDLPCLSKNVVAFEVTTTNAYPIRCRVYVESASYSNVFTLQTELKGWPVAGRCIFYLHDLFEIDLINYDAPDPAVTVNVCPNVCRRFKVDFYEFDYSSTVAQVMVTSGIFFVLLAGGDIREVFRVAKVPNLVAPVGVVAILYDFNKIRVNWNLNNVEAKAYQVEYSTDGDNWTLLDTVSSTTDEIEHTALNETTTYYYRVRAKSGDFTGPWSEVSETTEDIVPAVLSIDVVGLTLHTSWTDPNAWEQSYQLYRSYDGGVNYSLIASGAIQEYTDNDVTPGEEYYYKVITYHPEKQSESNVVSGIILQLSQPTSAAATLYDFNKIQVTWDDDNSYGHDGYRIERSTNGVDFTFLANVAPDVYSYSNVSLAVNTQYYYRIRTYHSSGYGAYSDVADATTSDIVASVLSVTAEDHVILKTSWTDPNSWETEYRLMRSDDGITYGQIAAGAILEYSDPDINKYIDIYYKVIAYHPEKQAESNVVVESILPDYISEVVDSELNSPIELSVSGNYAYVICSEKLVVVDISDPETPTIVASLSDATYLAGIRVIDIKGNYAYVGCNLRHSLAVINISNPLAPSYVGEIVNGDISATYIGITGNYVYMACGSGKLLIFNISSPTSPSLVGQYNDNPNLGGVRSVAIYGNYAVMVGYSTFTLVIVNVSNPTSPSLVTTLTNSAFNGILDVLCEGQYAYLVNNRHCIIVDLTTIVAPFIESDLNDSRLENAISIRKRDDYLYIACYGNDSLAIVDVHDPSAPSFLLEIQDSTKLLTARYVQLSQNYAYIPCINRNSLSVIQIDNQ